MRQAHGVATFSVRGSRTPRQRSPSTSTASARLDGHEQLAGWSLGRRRGRATVRRCGRTRRRRVRRPCPARCRHVPTAVRPLDRSEELEHRRHGFLAPGKRSNTAVAQELDHATAMRTRRLLREPLRGRRRPRGQLVARALRQRPCSRRGRRTRWRAAPPSATPSGRPAPGLPPRRGRCGRRSRSRTCRAWSQTSRRGRSAARRIDGRERVILRQASPGSLRRRAAELVE